MAVNYQSVALQLERVLQNPATLYPQETAVFDLFQSRKTEVVSSRQMRIPVKALRGGNAGLVSPDGGSFMRGSAYTPDVMVLSPVWAGYSGEVTYADMMATNNDKKAIENFLTDNVSQSVDGIKGFIESQMVGDGSGSLGAAVAIDTTGGIYTVTVANPALFADGQVLSVWSAIAGTNRGNVMVKSVDFVNKTITLQNTIPARFSDVTAPASVSGFTTGDLFMPYGSDGTATGSIYGVRYWHNKLTTGTKGGLDITKYPGKFSTPYVTANSGTLTQGLVRLLIGKQKRAVGLGNQSKLKSMTFLSNLDIEAQWESLGTLVSSIIYNQIQGDKSLDVMKPDAAATIAGRKLVTSNRALPQRLDGLLLDHWGKCEIQPLAPYAPTGQHVFQAYGSNGAVAMNLMYYYIWGGNLFNDTGGLFGAYADTIALQSGF